MSLDGFGSQSATNMFEIGLTVNAPELEPIEQVLFAAGALSITLQDAVDTAVFEAANAESPLWPSARVTALFADEPDIKQLERRLEATLGHTLAIGSQTLAEQDWTRLWMDNFKPIRCGNSLWVYPSWHDNPDPSGVTVCLDPGLAFGTGTHPTTALCLEWLDAHPPRGNVLIDYGCGSGILAIAALKLGACHVYAVDLDTQALQTTRENAQKNHIDRATLDIEAPQNMHTIQADVLMANILLGPLIELRSELSAHTKKGGTVVLSGILSDQTDMLVHAYADDFQFKRPRHNDNWVLLEGVKI